jgi:hypothetical protein
MFRTGLTSGVIVAVVTALAVATSAGATAVETKAPFTTTFENPCTGEPVVATGFVHTVADVRFGTDGSLHDQYHFNLQGVTGTGLTTGAKYTVQEEWNVGTNADDDHSTTHHIFRQQYVRTGNTGTVLAGDDFYIYFRLHITMNANGQMTAFRIETEEEPCR